MQLLDFFKDYEWDGRPFLITGKGPSFRDTTDAERDTYNIISLNHACRNSYADIAHIIDLDVLEQLGESLLDSCQYLVMPYYPHIGWRPNPLITLEEISQKNSVLMQFREQDRLYAYNLSTATQSFNKVWNNSPIVWANYFSAEAVVSLLGKLGVKQIRTLGIDGGIGQNETFKDLENINKKGYDAQWQGIRKSIKRFGLDYSVLGLESPIRIFIGAGTQQLIPALVLKHSIEKHATMSTAITIMNEWTHPMPKDRKNWPRTPFSFQRFMIPEKCNYEGHAIYMDSDMLVFGDVKDVWTAQMSKQVLAMRNDDIDKHRAKFSVLKFDCEKVLHSIEGLVSIIDSGARSYEDIVFDFKDYEFEDGWNPDWNSLESYEPDKTKLLHYTEMYNQPWLVNPNHPLGYLWFNELKEAVADGDIDRKLVEEHVSRSWILPKCLEVLNG